MERKVANWTGGKFHVFLQFIISLKSYLLYPFIKEKKNAIKNYWSSIYSNTKKDKFIFDGNITGYFDSLLDFIKFIPYIEIRPIVDLCSGHGTLYTWFKCHNISHGSYVGIDFSIPNTKLSENALLINKDIINHIAQINDIVIIINGLCYLNNLQYKQVIDNICSSNDLIIIEPVPSIFWDAQFNNIILYYRSSKQIHIDLENRGYKCQYESIDYLFKIFGTYIFGLKYTLYFSKNNV